MTVKSSGDRGCAAGQQTVGGPEIGDELATARALTDLGHRLLLTAEKDIEALTDERVRLDR